ncbi:MAG: glycoside hydrolase family 9 protein, partial [Capsulimonadaceae bacterium]
MIAIYVGFIVAIVSSLFVAPALAGTSAVDPRPFIESAYAAAPDVLALQVHEGQITPSHLEPYQPQPGDTTHVGDHKAILVRGGKEIGWLIPDTRNTLVTYEQFDGIALDDDAAGAASTYSISSPDDQAYSGGLAPQAVYRKSKPTDWAFPTNQFEMRHIVYLVLPHALVVGRSYVVSAGHLNVRNPVYRFVFAPARIRSESVHVSQIGYRVDDRPKTAFLSLWMGTGGAYEFPSGLTFTVVDTATGKSVVHGAVTDEWPADRSEILARTANFNKTGVWRMDFSNLSSPGRYEVVVDGVGCSYPFEISRDVWTSAFKTQMRGLINERGGVTLGPPYTSFRKPRDFNPADGARVYQSTYSILDGGSEWKGLAAHNTGKLVPEAWGGYHDAGDWNPRRVTHMAVTMAQLELAELFPHFFRSLNWNVPRTSAAPDIVNEALFELDLFRRLQVPSGGIRYGIETNGDPYDGEVSWRQSMPAYVYAPDLWSSYIYAAVAGRASKVLRAYDAAKSKTYEVSALRAMRWAESEWVRLHAPDRLPVHKWEITDARNYAAVILYDLTGDSHWHSVFLENTCLKADHPDIFAWGDHVQCDAAFAYVLLPTALGDPVLKQRARTALIENAEVELPVEQNNAWNLCSLPGRPMFVGFYSEAIGGQPLLRAHYLTGDRRFLDAAVQSCQFEAGCNPNNLTYTVGVG